MDCDSIIEKPRKGFCEMCWVYDTMTIRAENSRSDLDATLCEECVDKLKSYFIKEETKCG